MEEQGMGMREYRKGNWTVEETMILIEAKKMDDERRKLSKKQTYQHVIASPISPPHRLNPGSATASPSPSPSTSGSVIVKPVTELRWKWVEEYCWRKGCLRSQNQCNDKWDNLMRDYKKIRDYQRNLGNMSAVLASPHPSQEGRKVIVKSYWEMDKAERKDRNLPTNVLPQIYEALFDVVEHIGSTSITTSTSTSTNAAAAATTTTTPAAAAAATTTAVPSVGGGGAQFLQLPPPPSISAIMPSTELPVLRLRTQLPFYSQQGQQPVAHHLLPTLESEASEHLRPESSSKKRRKEERVAPVVVQSTTSTDAPTTSHHQMATTSTPTPTQPPATTSLQEVSSAICRSASIISEAIQSNEEKQERRHKEIMHLHETRLRIEESKLEVTRQGFIGLTDAINNLANSILTWANTSHKSHHQGP